MLFKRVNSTHNRTIRVRDGAFSCLIGHQRQYWAIKSSTCLTMNLILKSYRILKDEGVFIKQHSRLRFTSNWQLDIWRSIRSSTPLWHVWLLTHFSTNISKILHITHVCIIPQHLRSCSPWWKTIIKYNFLRQKDMFVCLQTTSSLSPHILLRFFSCQNCKNKIIK